MTTEEKAKNFANELDQLRIKYGLREVVFCIMVNESIVPGCIGNEISDFIKEVASRLATTVVEMAIKRLDGNWIETDFDKNKKT